ncbi:MAG: CBS domain-containing protein, partial [Acidimicrobiia bacterium]
MEPIEFIREIHPFDLLEASVVDLITDSLEVVHLPTGTWVIDRAGSAHRSLDIVREGAVRLERDGRPLMLVEEGEFYGHAELITGATPAEAVAESESVVYRLPEVVFRRLMEHSEFAHFFRLAGELALARLDPMGDSSFARSFRDLSDTIRRSQPGESPLRFAVDLALPAYRLLTRPPLRVGAQATVAEAARAMRDARASSVLVNDDPPGIVTDRDLRNRVLAQGMGADTPVAEVMSRPLRTLPAATPIFEALTFMVDEDIHHLPLEEGGEIVGVITDTVFLRHQARSPFAVLRRFERTHDRAVLARFPEELAGVAEAYLRGGVEPTGVGRVIGVWGDTLVRSIIRSTHATLGPPPAPYAWLGLG